MEKKVNEIRLKPDDAFDRRRWSEKNCMAVNLAIPWTRRNPDFKPWKKNGVLL